MIKSSYLNKEIDLKTGTATTASGRKNTIVFHHELERFINEALLAEGVEVIYDFIVYNSNSNDIVVKCDMWDKKQKRVVKSRKIIAQPKYITKTKVLFIPKQM